MTPGKLEARKGFCGFVCRKRKMLRWIFYPVWGIVLLLCFIFIWLATIGFPDFATREITRELKERGFDFTAQKLKLSWNLGVQAHGLNLSQDKEGSAKFYLASALLNLDFWRWMRDQGLIDSITIQEANLSWPLGDSPEDSLKIEEISGAMAFDEKEKNVWTLRDLRGKLLNTQIQIGGEMIHANMLSFKQKKERDPEALERTRRFIKRILDTLRTFDTQIPPKLILNIHLDAADWLASSADIVFDLQEVRKNHGMGKHFRVQLALDDFQDDSAQRTLKINASLLQVQGPQMNFYLDQIALDGALVFTTKDMIPQKFDLTGNAGWISNQVCLAQDLHFDLTAKHVPEEEKKISMALDLKTDNFQIHDIGGAKRVDFHTDWVGNWDFEKDVFDIFSSERFRDFDLVHYQELLDHPDFPRQANVQFHFAQPETIWGKMDWIDVDVDVFNRAPEEYALWNTEEYGPWRWAVPLKVDCKLDFGGIDISEPEIVSDQISLELGWAAPTFSIKKIYSALHHGELNLAAALDLESRVAQGKGEINFNAHRMAHLLDAAGRRWLSQYGWNDDQPPTVTAEAKIKLAEWTNLKPDWKNEVLPSLELRGHLQGTNANFRGIPALSAEGDFCLTNNFWTLPDFKVVRPEGNLIFTYKENSTTHDYFWDFTSDCNPKALGSVLGEGAQKALDMFEFTEPPHIEAKLWGRWHDLSKSGLDGTVKAKDFVFREQALESISSHVTYTNGLVCATGTELFLPPMPELFAVDGKTNLVSGQNLKVDEVTFSADDQQVRITNGVCHLYPRLVTKMIGPVTDRAMENYHFTAPPDVIVNGMIPVEEAEHSFIDFELVQSKGMKWWKIYPENLTGLVRWQGDQLSLTNLSADFYGGKLKGWAAFDFTERESSKTSQKETEETKETGADFKFDANFENCQIKPFMECFNARTNTLAGTMNGRLAVTEANTSDWDSWNGYGSLNITNGLIWDIPVFGLFSGFLNEISPGLGNSQATRGGGTFTITNSVVRTEDLEIASPTFQMLCKGTIDFQRKLDAQVDVDIFKGWGDIGKAINFTTTPFRRVFRCSVKGTFEQPDVQFTYLPRATMKLIHPIRSLKELFNSGKTKEQEESEKPAAKNQNPSGKPLILPQKEQNLK